MKRHVWTVCLGVAAVLAGAVALATGTGDSEDPVEEPDEAVVLGEEDLADRAEILRNMYRRITPPDVALVQDVGTWPAAWEEFGANWDSAAANREYGAWVVPVEVTQDAGETVVKDGNGAVLWRGWTDFARPESAGVVLTGGLVAEEEWPVYEGIREAAERSEVAGGTPAPPVRTNDPSGLRFTGNEWTADGTFRLELAYETDTNVDIFAYAVLHASNVVDVTWTNDENVVVSNRYTNWYSVGPPLEGKTNAWAWRGTVAISNGVAGFEDGGFPDTLSRQRFYAAVVADDLDGDGLNDGWEDFVSHTDSGNQDSDGDGVPDGTDTMPATSNVWFEVVHSKTNYFLQELGWVENNAPEVPFNDWSWIVSDQPPTSDSVLEDVRVSGYADDYITVDSHPINHTRGPYTYNNWHVINQINDLESLQFTMRLVDWPDANYAGSNVVCLGLSDADPFEVEWEWMVPMALTGPEYVCVGNSAQFEAGGAGGGPYTWSVSYEGATPVAEIDEYGMLTALAPGIATVTATAGEVYSVSQAMNVVQIDFLAGGGNTPASSLKIAKWGNAFVMTGAPHAALTNNFIDLDSDRFCVRVADPSQAGTGSVGILLSTTGADSAHNDSATAIDLFETSENSGIFVSTNLLLVSDSIDDEFSYSAIPPDKTRNDRTHKTAPGGIVRIQYPESGQSYGVKEISVPKVGRVHITPIIMRDLPAGEEGEPFVQVPYLEGCLMVARERFGQIGVDLTWASPEIRDPPSGMDLTGNFFIRDTMSARVITTEAKQIIAEVGTVGDISDIHMICVNHLKAGDLPLAGSSVTSFRYNLTEYDYFFNAFLDSDHVNSDTEYGGYLIAHELGHMLTNAGHETNDVWRLMYTVPETYGVAGSRRLISSEETAITGDDHVQRVH